MKTRIRVALLMLLLVAIVLATQAALHLMNQPSTASVIGGILTLMLVFVFVPTIVAKIIFSGRKSPTNEKQTDQPPAGNDRCNCDHCH